MPTIATLNGYRVVIYSADHRPAHVHVIGAAGETVFSLNCPAGSVEVGEIRGSMSSIEIRRIARFLDPEIKAFCAAWRKHHGNY
jgi:hypothetical protein